MKRADELTETERGCLMADRCPCGGYLTREGEPGSSYLQCRSLKWPFAGCGERWPDVWED